jgi:hypothetical protein
MNVRSAFVGDDPVPTGFPIFFIRISSDSRSESIEQHLYQLVGPIAAYSDHVKGKQLFGIFSSSTLRHRHLEVQMTLLERVDEGKIKHPFRRPSLSWAPPEGGKPLHHHGNMVVGVSLTSPPGTAIDEIKLYLRAAAKHIDSTKW